MERVTDAMKRRTFLARVVAVVCVPWGVLKSITGQKTDAIVYPQIVVDPRLTDRTDWYLDTGVLDGYADNRLCDMDE